MIPVWLHFVPWHWLLWLTMPFVLVAGGLCFAAAETTALLKKVPLSAWALIAAIVCGSLYHVAAVSAAADGAAKAEAAKTAAQIHDMGQTIDGLRSKLADVTAQAETDKAASDEKMKMAAKLVSQLGQEAAAAQTAEAELEHRLKIAEQSKDCATTASMKLCSAMQNY
jgi:Skp family chaperone for outer membrane proteins